MAKPVRFNTKTKARGSTSFNFGANVKPRKPRRGGKGGGS